MRSSKILLAVFLSFVLAVPMSLAAWDSGTADNSYSSGGSVDTSDSQSSWDSGTADNDDGGSDDQSDTGSETDSSQSWDNDTADNNDGANNASGWDNDTAQNNEDAWDNETAVNDDDGQPVNETDTWDNDTADNNDGGWDNETSENDDNGDPETTPDDSSDTGTFSDIVEFLTPSGISLDLQPDNINLGESTTVSGTLEGDRNSNRVVEIMVNGGIEKAVRTDNSGNYETTIRPDRVGDHEVSVEAADQTASQTLSVTGSVEIVSITTSSNIEQGRVIEVCPLIESESAAEVELFHNGQSIGTKQGTGEVCFETVVEGGRNTFRVVASVEGERDEETIIRDADPDVQGPQQESEDAGGFSLPPMPVNVIASVLGGLAVTAGVLYREGVLSGILTS